MLRGIFLPQFRTAMGRRVLFAVRGPIVVASLVFAAEGARGADLEVSPRIELEEAFSDNIDLARDNLRADFITTVRPGIAINGTGARFDFDVDYDYERLFFLDNSDQNQNQQRLLSRGHLELVKDRILLDARFSMSEQTLRGIETVSGSGRTETDDRTKTQIFSISPSVRHHFGGWADAEARYTFSQSTFEATGPSNTVTNRLAATVDSGREFSKFLWNVSLEAEGTDRSVDDPATQGRLGLTGTVVSDQADAERSTSRRLAVVDTQYVVNPKVSLLAGIGYERIQDATLDDEPDGLIWNLGAQIQPRPGTSIRATYGQRFEDNILTFAVSHLIGPRTTFTASFGGPTLQTSQRTLGNTLASVARDPQGGFLDARTNERFVLRDPEFGLSDVTFKEETLDASITRVTDRDTMRLDAFQTSRESDATGETQDVLGASFLWNRLLNRRTTANLDLSYRNSSSGDGGQDHFITIGADLDYRITEDITGSIIYDRTMQYSDDAQSEFTENVIAVRIRGSF